MTWDYYLQRISMYLWGLDRATLVCAIVSTAFCGLLFGICMCRMARSDKRVLKRVRLGYALLGTAAVAAFLLPITKGELGVWGAVIALEIGTVAAMLAGSHRWKYGAPDDVRSDLLPLEDVTTMQ